MKIINRRRQTGKTTMLLNTAYITGYPIIVITLDRAKFIRDYATRLGFKNITVYTLNEFINSRIGRVLETKVLIDDAEEFLDVAFKSLLEADVVACTMSIPCEDPEPPTKEEDK